MKTVSLILVSPLLLCGQSAHVSPNEFPWRAKLDIKETSGYAAVRINREFYERTAANFDDLRIFGPSGAEISCLLRDLHPASPDPSVQTQLLDLVRTRKGQLQFILDFGIAPPIHNRIVFDTPDPDFRRPVLIESSLDRTTWDLVRTAAILRFQQDGQSLESLRIDYADSARRYLRITIDSWKDPKSLTSVQAQRTPSPNAEDWENLASATPEVSSLNDRKSTRFEFSYPFAYLSEVRLVTSRRVRSSSAPRSSPSPPAARPGPHPAAIFSIAFQAPKNSPSARSPSIPLTSALMSSTPTTSPSKSPPSISRPPPERSSSPSRAPDPTHFIWDWPGPPLRATISKTSSIAAPASAPSPSQCHPGNPILPTSLRPRGRNPSPSVSRGSCPRSSFSPSPPWAPPHTGC